MNLRHATSADLGAINARYAAVDFAPSAASGETIVLAEVDGQHAGQGRIVDAGEEACELGGMLVDERFRGRGVARAIIDELLRVAGGRAVYCIPWSSLESVYGAAGFIRCAEDERVPAKVREKLEWCRAQYTRPVILMSR